VSKAWQPYARHVLDAIAKIRRIQSRGDITQDDILYDAALRNLQTWPRQPSSFLIDRKPPAPTFPGGRSAAFATSSSTITWAISTR